MTLLSRIRKSFQRTYNTSSPDAARAFDLGFDALGDYMGIYAQIQRLLNGGEGGVRRFTGAHEQLEMSVVSWGYSCIDRIAKEIAGAEWKIYKKIKGDWEPVDLETPAGYKAGDLMRVMEEPFAYGTESTFKEAVCRQLDACGYSPSVIERAGKLPVSLTPISPAEMRAERNRDGLIHGWQRRGVQGYKTEDVLYIYYPDPRNVFMPLSPLAAASFGLDINQSAFDYNAKLLKNDARPSGWFVPKTDVPLDKEKLELLKAWVKKQRGRVGGIETVPLGGTIQGQTLNPKDMDFNQGLIAASVEVCSAFGYPRPLITGEQINKSVMEVLLHLKNEACIIPRMLTIETALTMQVIRPVLGRDYWLAFDRPKVVFSEEARMLVEEVRAGIRTINEVRAERGEEAKPWGEKPPTAAPQFPGFNPREPDETDNEPKRVSAPVVLKLRTDKRVYKNAEERIWLWKSFDGLMRATERPFFQSISRSFHRQAKTLADRIKARADRGEPIDLSIFNPAEAEADMEKSVKDHVENGVWAGRDRAATLVRREIPANELRILNWITNYTKENASLITATTATLIQDYMDTHRLGEPAKALDPGIINVTLADYVRELTELVESVGRAGNVAETMSLGSINWGTFGGYTDAGVEKKEWLSQQDGNVRGGKASDHYDHRLDGITIPLYAKFNTGSPGGLDFPGDFNGDPGDICNCRCTILPVLEG